MTILTLADLVHFCWRPRGATLAQAELDLMMIPGDATFKPYVGPNKPSAGPETVRSPVNGRIFVLKFSSSSQRYLFWLQAKPRREPSQFSKGDLDLGERVNLLLQAEDVDYAAALGTAADEDDEEDEEGGDGDATMKDVDPTEEADTGDKAGQNATSDSAQGGSAPGGGTSGGRA